mmetsp:Transcript_8960/g.55111  ORF Transcript_8960/g.55111 Transcript_8960/m.55111 type:complete len:90 (-) Transcript_8960:1159-1428(-)
MCPWHGTVAWPRVPAPKTLVPSAAPPSYFHSLRAGNRSATSIKKSEMLGPIPHHLKVLREPAYTTFTYHCCSVPTNKHWLSCNKLVVVI